MMLRLTYISTTTIPVEAECIAPNALVGKTTAQIADLPVQHGNSPARLGDFFQIEGDAGDEQIVLQGDCSRVKLVGSNMTSGSITVEGNIGMHVGAEMRGGTIDVKGSAAGWVGAEMRDGTIRIRGDAGHLVGAGYRGSRFGMRGGVILVHGNAGNEIGRAMRRGLIAVRGDVADFAGVSMTAGTLLLFGKCGIRTAAGMKRGTVAVFGDKPQLLPTFRFDCVFRPEFLRIYLRYLQNAGFPIETEFMNGSYRRYSGDLVALGKGELLVPA
jgi:formylmethanofuran dehydrogenase subunit C